VSTFRKVVTRQFLYLVCCITAPAVIVSLRRTDGEPILAWVTAVQALLAIIVGAVIAWVLAKVLQIPNRTERPQ
jgi:hypothetical protein